VNGLPTVTGLLLARADDTRPGLRFEDSTWTWAEHVRACACHAAVVRELLAPGEPPHIGILADNVPSFSFLLGAAALYGAVLVGLNPTRRGGALARDIRISDCQLVLVEAKYATLLEGLNLGMRVLDLGSPEWTEMVDQSRGAPVDPVDAGGDDLLMLIFTSGTGGEPKAVRCTHGKIAFPGRMLADRFGLSTSDTVYVSMPMFHSNAIMAGWSVGLAAGAAIALRRRFSASGFLDDVRKFGATFANYVGKPLSYVLATPPRPDDNENPLKLVHGNEGDEADLAAFGTRFGCHVVDAFGSTEGGVNFGRSPGSPPGSLGKLPDGVEIRHPDTGVRCPAAQFDADGQVVNSAEAVGELVNIAGAGWFAGYYNDPHADGDRLRGGMYHTGDLAYADANGFCYFAGRRGDWLRVDGENLGTAPIERTLSSHPDIAEAAVYPAPDDRIGDQVMAALVLWRGDLDPAGFGTFLSARKELGPKQLPRYVRIVNELPKTSTNKVLKRELSSQGWECSDVVWWRPGCDPVYERLN
jgi:fatty-acyl-CoA synthase